MKTKITLRKNISGKELSQFFLDLNWELQEATKYMDIVHFEWVNEELVITGISKGSK